jgi:hypothetical protein
MGQLLRIFGDVTTYPPPASHVLAAEYVAPDLEGLWSHMTSFELDLDQIGTRHVVVYSALREPNRVFVTVGIRHDQPVETVLRSPQVFDWFDAAGVTDLPPLFVGETLEKLQVCNIDEHAHSDHASVVVAAIVPVADVDLLVRQIHERVDRFHEAGVLKIWVYRALDSGTEVMVLQEIDTEEHAARWIDEPDASMSWIRNAGAGFYPPLFVGRMARVQHFSGDQRDG